MAKSIYVERAGEIVDFPDSATPQQMQAYIDRAYGPAETTSVLATPPAEQGVGPWESAGLGWLSRVQTAGGGFAESLGYGDTAKYLYEKAQKNLEESQQYQPKETSITGAETWGGSAEALGEAAIQSAPDLAGGLAAGYVGGQIGAGIGALGGPFAPVTVPTAALVGGLLGAGLYSFGVSTGSNIQRQAQEKGVPLQEADEGTAIAAAAAQAPLDAIADRILLGKLIPSGAPANVVRRIVGEGIVKHAVKGATAEGLTEAAQQAIEIGQANPEKLFDFSPEVQAELADAAFAGGFLGGGVGAASVPAGKIADYYRARPFRQLQKDLASEGIVNLNAQRQGNISQAAEELRQYNVEGPVDVTEEEVDGITKYTIKSPAGNSFGRFDTPEDASSAVDLYSRATGAKVRVKAKPSEVAPSVKPIKIGKKKYGSFEEVRAARDNAVAQREAIAKFVTDPDLLKEQALAENVPEEYYQRKMFEEVQRQDKIIGKLNAYLPETKTEEAAPPAPVKTASKAIPYDTVSYDEKAKGKVYSSGEAPVIDYGGRKIVIKNINGVDVPFYLSSGLGGKKGVPAGKWYPFFGIGKGDGWINKTSSEEMANYYGVPEFRVAAEELDAEFGDIRNDASIPKVAPEGRHIDYLNEGFDPADNQAPDTLDKVRANIDATVARIRTTEPPPAVANPVEPPIGSVAPPKEEISTEPPVVPEAVRADEAKPEVVQPQRTAPPPEPRPFTPEYKAKMDRIYTSLLADVRKIAPPEVELKLVELIDSKPGLLIRGVEYGAKTETGVERVIELSRGIFDPNATVEDMVKRMTEDLNHEIIHALRNMGLFRKAEWNVLSKSALNAKVPKKSYTYLDRANAIYRPNGIPIAEVYASDEALIEEAIADMYKDWVKNRQAPQQAQGLLNRVTEFFRRIFRALKSTQHEEVFKAIEAGKLREREIEADAGEKVLYSAVPIYDPRTSTSDWEKSGAPPSGISSVNKTGGSPFRISQRRPTSVKKVGASLNENLLVDVKSMKLEPGVFEHNIDIVNSYPGFPVKKGENPDATLKRFKKHVVDNLLWLHDKMDPALRDRAKLWYDGARKITDNLAAKYDLPDTTVAAVLAGLSPQKDWFQNVSLAERLIDIVVTKRDVPFDDAMFDYAMTLDAVAQYAPMLRSMRGMTLNDLKSPNFESFLARKHNEILAGVFDAKQAMQIVAGDVTLAKSIFVRVYDEMNNPRVYNIITPEGDKGAVATTNKGGASSVAWGSFTEIGKGVNAIDDGTKESIDILLGDKHKIRNFYNNIISPKSTDGSVTIDTHAVAAALMRALAGGSVEVHHNFGTSVKGMTHRTRNSSITGVQGLYAIYADAYREAAKARGILPREMQSITWEAVRGLYKPRFKGQKKNVQAIDDIWRLHSDGKITANEARKRVLGLADPGAEGINSPFWKDTPGTVIYGVRGPALNTSGVRQAGLRQAAGGTGSGGTGSVPGSAKGTGSGVKFSAAPAVNTEEFKLWFRNSKAVNPDGTPKVFYHGTPFSFKEFGKGRSASLSGETGPFYFSDSPKFASQYAETAFHAGGGGKDIKKGGRMIPVYLSVKNPFDADNPEHLKALIPKIREGVASGRIEPKDVLGWKDFDAVERAVRTKTIAPMDVLVDDEINKIDRVLSSGGWYNIENRAVQKAIRDLGFDGFYVKESGFKNLAVYSPQQVKSTFNQFEPGTAESKRFSAAPLPPYVEQRNRTLFRPQPEVPFYKSMFDFFFGHPTVGKTLRTAYGNIDVDWKTRFATSARVAGVDKNAYVEYLEKAANQKATGNFDRLNADYSAVAALTWFQRSSQLAASVIMMGKPSIKFDRAGDIQSATIAAEEDPDSLMNVFKIMLEPGPVDSVTGKAKDNREAFKTLATAKRAIGLKAAGKPVPRELDDTYIREAISSIQANHPEVVRAYEMYQRFNKNLLTAARDAGVITSQELAALSQKMDYYGFYREVFEEELVPGSTTRAAAKFDLREYKGSEYGNLIDDPMFVIVQNTQFWMNAIARNLATTKAFKLANDMGEARLLGSTEKPDPSRGESEQVMFFRENGVQKRFAVSDPMLVTALGSDDRLDMGKAMKLMGMPTQFIRESVTRDPAFMITNLIRDTLSSWITSGEDITPFLGTAAGFAKALKGSASFQALMGRGVVGSYDLAMREPQELAAIIRRRLTPKNVHSLTSPEGAMRVGAMLWDRLGVWSEASDAATRIAVYEAAKAQGLSEAEATFRAIQIMDFSRRGASTTLAMLTKLVPFLNARIQGLDVLYQAGRAGIRVLGGKSLGERDANLGKKFLVRGAMLAAISLALEYMNDDDEAYDELPDYLKKSNLLIPLKGFGLENEFLAIAKPFEAGLLFSTIPQQFYKTMAGEVSTRDNINFFVESYASTFNVNPIPQIILPALEVIVNHDFYTGLPLISEGKARLSPELQYDSRTSTLARMLGEVPIKYNLTTGRFEGISPIVIDQLIGGYAGPFGTLMASAVGMGMEGVGVGPERLPRAFSEMPIVKRFFVDAESRSPKTVAQAYELFRIVDEANRSFSRLRQTGDAEAVADYLDENRDVLKYKKYVYKLVDSLNKLSAHERQIERDKTMTDVEKREAMNRLREVRKRLTAKVGEINKALGR